MRRSLLFTSIIILAVVAFLAVPFSMREQGPRPIVGPSLDQFSYEDVTFQNGELELAGMLMIPDGSGPFPGAVFIHGSGTSRRDNKWYLSVADVLLAHQIAVLLPDKRGSEFSGGDWRDTSIEELATDTQAAVDFLSGVPAVDQGRIGVIGFSQGGWIAPVVGANNPSIAFVVSMSGASVTPEEQLWFEEVNNIAELGTYRFLARLIANFTVPSIQQRPTFRAIAGFDPMAYWPAVTAPVFAALSTGDTSVPVEESARLFRALPGDVTVRIYPDGGHGITDPSTGRIQQAYLDDLVSFILSATMK